MCSTPWKRWMLLFPWLVCLVAGLSSSCTMLRGGQRSDDQGLLHAADRFSRDVRWGDYRSALAWIAPEAKEEFMDQADRLQGHVQIMEYQIMETRINGLSGNVILRYRFYQKQNSRLQTKTLHQQWLEGVDSESWSAAVKEDRSWS